MDSNLKLSLILPLLYVPKVSTDVVHAIRKKMQFLDIIKLFENSILEKIYEIMQFFVPPSVSKPDYILKYKGALATSL
jgi:hypothetical protein